MDKLDLPDKNSQLSSPSKFTYSECAERYIRNHVIPSKMGRRKTEFGHGSYTDVSGETHSPHNFPVHPEGCLPPVGRQSELLWIIKYLVDAPNAGQHLDTSMNFSTSAPLKLMNVYGSKGIGKKGLLTSIAW